ncbi:MAG: single-stranded-DNA-specific exonuclease RecJ [Rickettsiales bacterium]|nr:single-stranded-DNA-specific exonuclease RecJ [Rickettsiales bacterium]
MIAVAETASGCRWTPRIDSVQQEREAMAIAQQHGISEVLARVLVGRGVTVDSTIDYLQPTLKALLPDPSHLLDMDKAVARLLQALENQERIAVFGDYDVDGATSSAVLARYFAALGSSLDIYIPDRMQEGYGPNEEAFAKLIDQGVQVIITVDCGSVAFDPIAYAKERGVDVIVLDHHKAEARLPEACALVNPNRIDQDSDCGHLAAVGVVFLVLVALNKSLRENGYFLKHQVTEPNLLQWLDLVALGTVCDVVSLSGVNRSFVAQGLKVMQQRSNKGITALCDMARIDEPPAAYHAGFLIGPRINAGGRVGQSSLGATLLSSDDPTQCMDIAKQLDQFNAERQAIEAEVLEQAMLQAEAQHNQPCIVVASEHWHEGVIGIVAGRIKESFQRPAVVITYADGVGKGSARSVSGADIGAAITSAKAEGLLLKGGGHAMAGGLSIAMEHLDAFTEYLQQRLSQAVTQYALERAYLYDAEISVSGANTALINLLDQAGPFGMGNPGPRFVLPEVKVVKRDIMKEKHLRLIVSDANGSSRLNCVSFNSVGTALGDVLMSCDKLHLAGNLKLNRWNGYENPQLMIDDAARVA